MTPKELARPPFHHRADRLVALIEAGGLPIADLSAWPKLRVSFAGGEFEFTSDEVADLGARVRRSLSLELIQDRGIVGSFVFLLDQIAELDRPSSSFLESLSALPVSELETLLALAEAELRPNRQRIWEIRTAIEMGALEESE